jgi:hypothetical protein
MTPKAQIFLSYARPDEEAVSQLYQQLVEAGFRPWMDTQDILPGEDWKLAIQRAIDASDFFLVCMSNRSINRRGFLQREIREALDIWQEQLDSDIYVIPVRLEACDPPEALSTFQWVDLFEDGGWRRLVNALRVGMRRRTAEPAPDQPVQSTSGANDFRVRPPSRRSLRRKLPKREGTFIDFLLSPPRGFAGITALMGAGVVGNLLAGVITVVWGSTLWQLAIWILSILALLYAVYLFWRRSRPQMLLPENQQPGKHRGLILLVGTGRPGEDPMSQSAGDAITYHLSDGYEAGLEVCWLVASSGEKGSFPVAQRIQEVCQGKGVTAPIYTIADPFSVQETHDLVQRIYAEAVPQAGLSEDDVIADFTGGVKPMSAGMVLACGERRAMQYMYGRKKTVASVPRLIEFTPRGRR